MSKIKIFALGGLNENGKNMYVINVDDSIFVLDAGLKYADDRMLGIDYVIPNYDYLKENASKIKGIFISLLILKFSPNTNSLSLIAISPGTK